jgi:hypothetical protein
MRPPFEPSSAAGRLRVIAIMLTPKVSQISPVTAHPPVKPKR